MLAAHLQLLTGFILFILLFSEVNHLKVGIKMLFAIVAAIAATLNNKKITINDVYNPTLILNVQLSATAAIFIAFLL